jgi:hypothetical protein
MHRAHAILEHCRSPSMVVHDLDIFRSRLGPTETNPELIVDTNTVLPCPITL